MTTATITRDDDRYTLDHADPRNVLIAWAHGTMPMGGWTEDDPNGLLAAVKDEYRHGSGAELSDDDIEIRRANTIAALRSEASGVGCVVAIDDDSVTLRPDGGDTSEWDVIFYADEDSDTGLMIGEGGHANPFEGTLSGYLSEREATNNWA